jgi:tRNA(Arg) A34 adenosine deaminase TadA
MQYYDLSLEWKYCFNLARKAFNGGVLPIGCVILDGNNRMLVDSYAKLVYGSKKSNITQHAEMIALSKIPISIIDQKLILYTTVEPCPMCFGAVNVARISELHYATRDPWAGSTNLLNGNWYMKRKQINIIHEQDDFEMIMACWVVYTMTRGMNKKDFVDSFKNEFASKWGEIVPNIITIVSKLRDLQLDILKKDDRGFFDLLNNTIFGKDDLQVDEQESKLNLYKYIGNANQTR